MPTDKFRCSVTFDPFTLARLGIDAGREENQSAWTINGCLRRLAMLVEQASRELEAVLTRAEWNLLADALNGCADVFDLAGSPIPALTLVRAEVADAHALNRLGDKWLLTEKEEQKLTLPKARKLADERAVELNAKLAALASVHGEAILAAVRWFWTHTEPGVIDHTKDEWWKPEFRALAATEEKE